MNIKIDDFDVKKQDPFGDDFDWPQLPIQTLFQKLKLSSPSLIFHLLI